MFRVLVIVPASELKADDSLVIDYGVQGAGGATIESVFNTGHDRVQLKVLAGESIWLDAGTLVGVWRHP